MRAILPLLASLMLMLTAFTVAAHAAERPVAADGGHAGPVADEDDDTADGEHALVHQHGGCHGHFLDIPREPAFSCRLATTDGSVFGWAATLPVSRAPPPYLRPPRA